MPSAIKVVHISTFDQGGAATAALRLHAGLIDQGVDSSFIFLKGVNNKKFNKAYQYPKSPVKQTLFHKILRNMGMGQRQDQKNLSRLKNLDGSYEIFTFPSTDYFVEAHPLVLQADVINLHWIGDFINYSTFFKSVKQPIVWTVHDENATLGGFHYNGDKVRNPAFSNLEETLMLEKKAAISFKENMTIVSPSVWLKRIVESSETLSKKICKHIPYSLDTRIFKQYNRNFSREVFNLPSQKKILLFVTDNIANYRKGFDLLLDAIDSFQSSDTLQIVTIGGNLESLNSRHDIVSMGRIIDERLLALLYAAADIFVLPSREDNFPNVVLESLACGTPVISFKTGGMVDAIEHGVDGILVDTISSQALSSAIRSWVAGEYNFDRMTISQRAASKFNLNVQADRYEALYRSLIQS